MDQSFLYVAFRATFCVQTLDWTHFLTKVVICVFENNCGLSLGFGILPIVCVGLGCIIRDRLRLNTVLYGIIRWGPNTVFLIFRIIRILQT